MGLIAPIQEAPVFLQKVLQASFILNFFSIVCDAIIVISYFVTRWRNYKLVDRVTVRIFTAVAAIDIWFQAYEIFWYTETKNKPLCSLFSWLDIFMSHIYYTFNIAIALNIYFVVLRSKPYNPRREWQYLIFTGVTALIISLPFFIIGKENSNGSRRCYIAITVPEYYRLTYFFTDGIWFVLNLILSLSIALLTYSKLARFQSLHKVSTFGQLNLSQDKLEVFFPIIRKIILRTIFLPCIPVLTLSFMTLYQLTTKLTQRTSHPLETLAFIFSSLTGILNLTFLLMDPVVQLILKEAFYRRCNKAPEAFLLNPISSLSIKPSTVISPQPSIIDSTVTRVNQDSPEDPTPEAYSYFDDFHLLIRGL